MRERPIGDLVAGLKQLGADVDCFLGTNCPPVRVVGKGGLPGGKVSFALVLTRFCVSCLMHVSIVIHCIFWHQSYSLLFLILFTDH